MRLPVLPPVAPMLAKPVRTLPTGPGYLYEPKWDGFRCIVFRDGDEVVLGSRRERPLTRYFPELVIAIRSNLPERCVVDGEIVLPRGDRLDFDALLARIHPADSRVRMLAEQTPASFVAFDLLARDDEALLDTPFAQRRQALEEVLGSARPPIYLTALTTDVALAQRWFATFEGAGLDGVVAKAADLPYRPDQRVMLKVKHERTADCVVAGFRWHRSGPVVGSLLLGLYDSAGRLQHVGVVAAFTARRRQELVDELEPYRADAEENHPWANWATGGAGETGTTGVTRGAGGASGTGQPARMPGAQSRWSAGKDLSWVPLRPELVVEVRYDHMEGTRFRHTAQFVRWRTDREATSCTYAQLEEPVRYDLADVLR